MAQQNETQLNQQILDDLIALTLDFRAAKACRYLSARMIWEYYRGTKTRQIQGDGEYKLNNNDLPRYARAIMEHPGLEGAFRKRRCKGDVPEDQDLGDYRPIVEIDWEMEELLIGGWQVILVQADLDTTSEIFRGVFPDAVLVHTRIVPQGVRVRVVYEDDDRNQALVIQGDHVRAVETPEEYRQLVTDAAKEHRFRTKLAKVLA